jgi:hypothetical protein
MERPFSVLMEKAIMPDDLLELLEAAKGATVSECEMKEQRVSFAYGNTHFENEEITREMVCHEAESLEKDGRS